MSSWQSPEALILMILGMVIALVAVNRMTVSQRNWFARELNSLSYIAVGFIGMPLIALSVMSAKEMQDPLGCLFPVGSWLLCAYLVHRWLRLMPPPESVDPAPRKTINGTTA